MANHKNPATHFSLSWDSGFVDGEATQASQGPFDRLGEIPLDGHVACHVHSTFTQVSSALPQKEDATRNVSRARGTTHDSLKIQACCDASFAPGGGGGVGVVF